ncbi:MAG TPA: MaoC family dehydratase N-terminal domain-containing protein [Thermoanaerobaculia bacterium]|nr:MaoC family dehydratase N-terminal domain-containing protein [Thermoanaerobaculia bacterium]
MADIRFPVEASHILMFARAVGDPNPVYADPGHAARTEVGGIIAPPTFCQASAQFDPDYFLRPRIGEPWFGSGKEPTGTPDKLGGGTGLHAEQHFEYHRPPRAGDVLTATSRDGETWEKQGRRGGKLVFNERITEYRDQAGELVVTARSVGVRTEKVVEQGEGA